MSPFTALALEALRDATRRRIVPVIVAISLLSLLALDSCTACAANLQIEAQGAAVTGVSGWTALSIFVVLGLWVLTLAGVLAADHLAECIGDGSGVLVLARPVRRDVFAWARLAGVLAVALSAGAMLLGAAVALLHARQDVEVAPALGAMLACAMGGVVVASLSMAASLHLPRIATALLAVTGVGVIAATNLAAQLGVELGGVFLWLDRYGPPLATAMIQALGAWIEPVEPRGDAFADAVRLVLWAGLAQGLLLASFRRVELTS
jgi:hypothetical protein